MRASLQGQNTWYILLFTLLLAVAGTFIFLLIGILLLPVFFTIELNELLNIIQSPLSDDNIEIYKWLQGFNTIGTLLFPALIVARLISGEPAKFLRLESFPSNSWAVIVLTAIVALSGMVISDFSYRFSTAIPFPETLLGLKNYFDEIQQLMEGQIAAFLVMHNFMDFLQVFTVLAILPALCEETLFRGLLQPLFIRSFRNIPLGIIITSVIFGILHQQFYSFLSIVALSVVLGYLKEWSKSLWVPVIMHLINNGSIIVAVYFFNLPVNDIQSANEELNTVWLWPGLILFILSLWGLNRLMANKKGRENRDL